MKTKDLEAILENEEMSVAEKKAAIMALNGKDVNDAKDKYASEITSKDEEIAKLKGSNEELSKKVEGFADYEDLKKYKTDNEAKLVADKHLAYLKGLGFEKGADLIADKVDWEKATYDEEKKTYTGIDEEALKTNYDYLLSTEPEVKKVQFNGAGNGKTPKVDGVTEAFMKLNPDIKL